MKINNSFRANKSMALLNRADSSTESQYDFSDEPNESVHFHHFFSKDLIDDELPLPDSTGRIRKSRPAEEDSKIDEQA